MFVVFIRELSSSWAKKIIKKSNVVSFECWIQLNMYKRVCNVQREFGVQNICVHIHNVQESKAT